MDFPLACNCNQRRKETSSKKEQLKIFQGGEQGERPKQHMYQIHPKQAATCNYALTSVRGDTPEGRWEAETDCIT